VRVKLKSQISQRSKHPKELSFGWQRAQLLGAFFNGVFLLSLGISIFLQSIDRFVSLERMVFALVDAMY
jgi:zinc transporter 1